MPPSSNPNPRRDGAPQGAPPPSGPPSRRATSSRPGPSSRSSAPAGGSRPPTSRPTSKLDDRTVDLTAPRRPSSSRPSSKGAPKSPAKHTDPGAKRRAQKKVRARQNNLLAWTVALAVTVMIGGAAAGVWSELQAVKGRVSQKTSTLADLKMQLESGKRRLSALSSSSGKERVLVENGFIKPGERLLLFPKPTPTKNN